MPSDGTRIHTFIHFECSKIALLRGTESTPQGSMVTIWVDGTWAFLRAWSYVPFFPSEGGGVHAADVSLRALGSSAVVG